jgi:hypothetical protein
MKNAQQKLRQVLSGGLWLSLIIMTISALEFSWVDHVLGDELIAVMLTLVTPLPFPSLLSRRRPYRTR